MNNSVWIENVKRPEFESLKSDIKTDVLIIGGGITGILCAYMLKSKGVDCVVVEADRICSGTTVNTTAKITLQHGLIYDKIIQRYGIDKAKLYYEAQNTAMKQYRILCKDIPCGYEEKTSYVYSMKDCRKIYKEMTALEKIGCPAVFAEKVSLSFPVAGAVGIEHQAQFHPLEFAFSISKNITVYEKTKVLELKPRTAVTEGGKITFDKAVIATHFPILNKHGAYYLKLYQHRSYVAALENAENVNGMYVDEDMKGMSFRDYNGLLLIGGGSHRTGKKGGCWHELEKFSKAHYPEAKIINRWATQDCMTLDNVPYIGEYSSRTQNLYVATGFNKWGMTSAMTAAMILTDLIRGKDNCYAKVFSPSRSTMHLQLGINAAESLIGLLTPTAPRCPHMGCALKYNAQEHSWDCPCHGSRFAEDGALIDNPATDDKKNM